MAEEEKRDVKLNHTRMKEAQFVRNLWVVTAEQGVTKEDLLKPDYWSHVSFQFRPYDRIEARCDDGTFFAEYLIMSCERTFAKVKELSFTSLTSRDVAMTQAEQSAYEYKYRGPSCMHSIIRSSDKVVMVEKLDSKQDALTWLHEHEKAMK